MDGNDTAASPELQTRLTGMEPALLGDSAAMRALRHEIARIASLDVTRKEKFDASATPEVVPLTFA
jgi:hypothetical protein